MVFKGSHFFLLQAKRSYRDGTAQVGWPVYKHFRTYRVEAEHKNNDGDFPSTPSFATRIDRLYLTTTI